MARKSLQKGKRSFQEDFEIRKWLESEEVNYDLCGSYEFCPYCNKELDMPCERAFNLYKEDIVEEEVETTGSSSKHYPTFDEKLAKASDSTKEKYAELIELLNSMEFTPIKLKYSVVVRYKGLVSCGRITISRGVLRLHLALNPSSYMRYKHFNLEDTKAYQNYPFTIIYHKRQTLKSTARLLQIVAKKAQKSLN